MFRHTLLLAYRSFLRFKSTFFINLIGLSTGLACALLIYLWVNDELSVDRFYEKDKQLFQVMQNMYSENGIETGEATPALLAKTLVAEMPEVAYSVTVIPSTFNSSKGVISIGDTHLRASGQYVTKDFFNVFSYRLIQGNKNQVISDKKGVVISKELAGKLFKTVENAVGKTIEWKTSNVSGLCFVAGVFESPPANATSQFDLLLNYELFEEANPSAGWGNRSPHTYVLLKEGVSLPQFNSKIKSFLKSKDKDINATLLLQRYSDRYLYGQYENGAPVGGRIQYVKLFSIIALFILLIACSNFMNLSTAKASRRLKEVGVKKVLGAGRMTLILQYLGESMFMVFLSLGLAILLVIFSLAFFNTITGKNILLHFDPYLMLSVLGIATLTGLLAGSYPALYLSGFKPVMVLKGKLATSFGEIWVRKGLVVLQFAISILLIVAVWVVYEQMGLVQSKNLGYQRAHVIWFNTEKMDNAFMAELRNTPGVINAGAFLGNIATGGWGGTNGINWPGKSPADETFFTKWWISYSLLETLGIEIAAGRTFSEDFNADNQVIFNQAALESMGLKDPVGKTIEVDGEKRQIVGVVKDFHFESLYEKVKPCVILLAPTPGMPKVMVKMQAGTEKATLEKLQKTYQIHNPGFTFDYKFLDEDYQKVYASEQRVATLSRYFAGIAILISCLGLFGLAAFTAERRRKEIGVRKVMGASRASIVYLLSSDFTKLVLVAICLSLPVSYLVVKQWLNNFEYRIALEWWYFVGAGLAALVIAWLTVSTQAVKAASVNPVNSLKDE